MLTIVNKVCIIGNVRGERKSSNLLLELLPHITTKYPQNLIFRHSPIAYITKESGWISK